MSLASLKRNLRTLQIPGTKKALYQTDSTHVLLEAPGKAIVICMCVCDSYIYIYYSDYVEILWEAYNIGAGAGSTKSVLEAGLEEVHVQAI